MNQVESKSKTRVSHVISKHKNSCKYKFLKFLRQNSFIILTVISVFLAIFFGIFLKKKYKFNHNHIKYFGFIGEIFLRLLKLLIFPLITFSLISSIASLSPKGGYKIALQALLYYFSTTFIAVSIGICLVTILKPGIKNHEINRFLLIENDAKITTTDTFLDVIRNLFPDNLIEIAFREYETVLVPEYVYRIVYANGTNLTLSSIETKIENSSDFTIFKEIKYYRATASSRRNMNTLGLILLCFIFGYVLAKMGRKAKNLLNSIEILNEAVLKMIDYVMFLTPLGISSLVLATILEMEDPIKMLESLSIFLLTVILGLFIHGLLVLPVIYSVFTRKNVFVFGKNMLGALFIAFSTASSAAALPKALECTQKKNKVNKLISQFVQSVGSTINMDGAALYESVAVIFIAQLNQRDLTFVDIIVIVLTATLASIGAASVPGGGLVTSLIVLNALKLPTNQISLIYAVDWILDRFRTTINVWGDSIGAGILDHLNRKELEQEVSNESELESIATQ